MATSERRQLRRPVVGVMGAGEEATPAVIALAEAFGTALGQSNLINVLAADAVVVCGSGGPGTASEACHAIKAGKPLLLLQPSELWAKFLRSLDPQAQVYSDVPC